MKTQEPFTANDGDLLLVVGVERPGSWRGHLRLLSPPVCRLGWRGWRGDRRGLESLVTLVQQVDLPSDQFLGKTLELQ